MKQTESYYILIMNYFIKLCSLYQTVLFGDFQCLDEVQSYILVNRTLEEDQLVEGYNVHGFLHLVSSFPFYLLYIIILVSFIILHLALMKEILMLFSTFHAVHLYLVMHI